MIRYTLFLIFLVCLSGCESKVAESTLDSSTSKQLKSLSDPESSLELLENSTLKIQGPSCTGAAAAKFIVTQQAANPILCQDQTRLNPSLKQGPTCPEGFEIKTFEAFPDWVPCEELRVCGRAALQRRSLATRGNARLLQLEFGELPWGCEGKILVRAASVKDSNVNLMEIPVSFNPPPCPSCNETQEPTCALCGEDPNPPLISQVETDTQDCNQVRVIVFASDVGAGLHRKPYSFDGGKEWQEEKFKDFRGLDFKMEAAKIQVRDRAGNVTTFQKALQAVAKPCPCETKDGGSVAHGESVSMYKFSSVNCDGQCEVSPQPRTCTNGLLSGDSAYSNLRCRVEGCPGCKLPWGEAVDHGTTVTAYNAPAVTCADECSTGTLTCDRGKLLGDPAKFPAKSCASKYPTCNCRHEGAVVENGKSLKVYAANEVNCGSECKEGQVTCNLGSLSGDVSYKAISCSPKICKCRTQWGGLLDLNQSVEAFRISKMDCEQNIKCEDQGNRVQLRCDDVIENKLTIAEGAGELKDFKFSSCSRAACGCVHLNVFFRPSDPPMKVYKLEKAEKPQTCEAAGNFGKVTCKEIVKGVYRVEGDTNTSTFKFAQCENVTNSKGSGTGMSDHNVGAGVGGGAGGGLGNDLGDGEGFRRRGKGGGGGVGGDGCDLAKPPYYCGGGFTTWAELDKSMCFLPFPDGYKVWQPTSELDIRHRISPGGFIPAFSKNRVGCGEKCSKYMGMIRCDGGFMSGKDEFKYTDCVESCP